MIQTLPTQFATRLAILLMMLCAICPTLSSQIGEASLIGTVTDTLGARVPGATLVITKIDTGTTTTIVSDSKGLYAAPSLPIGQYQIEATLKGFKKSVNGPITLTVGRSAVVDVSLVPGTITETVQVTTDVPQVETSDTGIGWLVGPEQVQQLPLNGRNYVQLMLLAPGIQPVPQENTEGAATLVPFGFGSPQRFSVAGGRPQGQLFLVDGTDTAGVWGNGTGLNLAGTSLGVDGIAEFQALTDTYSANYGGNGGVLNAALRSGTNSLHGSVYEYARNSALDARNYFDPYSGVLPFSKNQFGGTIGGPIVKDNTFFFANYEQLEQSLTTPFTQIVPDNNFRQGYLPCAATFGLPCDTNTGLAFVGVAPGVQSYLNTYPAANGAELLSNGSPTGSANSTSYLSQPVSEHYGVVKISHVLGASDTIDGSYVVDDGQITAYANPTVKDFDTQRNQYITVEERKVISPEFLNIAHISYARSNINVASIYNPNLNIVPGSGPFNGTIDVVGLSAIGGADNAQEVLDRYTLRDQVSLVRGRNSLQAGLEFVVHQLNVSIPIINGGEAVYEDLSALGLPIQPFQAFLQNIPLAFAGVPLGEDDSRRNVRHNNIAPYVQDKFTATPRLTLNAGMRYDFETNPTETHDKLYNLIDPFTSAGFTKVPNAFQHNPTIWNFEPRVGFAWDPTGDRKMSIRGGIGVFDDLPLEMQVAISYLFNPPVYNVQTILLPTIPDPFASGGINATGLPGGAQLTAYKVDHDSYVTQYNLFVQRDLTHNMVFTLGYVGSKANHLFIGQETNGCVPSGTLANGLYVRTNTNTATCTVPNPNLSSVVDRFPVGSSNYNSMQVAVDRGIGQFAQFRAAYTFSKCFDVGSYYTGNDSIGPNGQTFGLQAGSLASGVRNIDYGPCDYDLRNNFTANAVIQLPFKGNQFKEGWQLTAITSLRTGTPFSVYDGVDEANVGQNGASNNAQRPDLVPGFSANATHIDKSAGAFPTFYNPNAFEAQPNGIFGNLSRNTLTAPSVKDLDMGIAKNTRLGEGRVLQIRAEAFNLTNHTNFGFPNAQLFTSFPNLPNNTPDFENPTRNGAAGQITNTATTSRQIQLSAKFQF